MQHASRIIAVLVLAMTFCAAPASASTNFYPLGDSLTWGQGSVGGYRDRLYTLLQTNNFHPQYVGQINENATSTLASAGQTEHDGHPGWRTQDLDANINQGYGFLRNNDPDVILIMAGTNDLINNATSVSAIASMRSLVTHATTLRPDATLIVASIPPIWKTDVHNPNDPLLAYNASLPGMAAEFRGMHVFFADQYHNFIDANGEGYGLPDGIHPDITGYNRMADTWFTAIQAAVPEPASLSLIAFPVMLLVRRRR